MSKTQSKLLIAIGGLVFLGPVLLVALYLMSDFLASFNQGADPASIFHGHQLVLPQPEEARYIPSVNRQGKVPTRAERNELISAYWAAWSALTRAQETGLADDLATYWAGPALGFARNAETQPYATAEHKLQLRYLSPDGSLATLTDVRFTLTTADLSVTATAEVVMTLDNGFWRIRLIELNYAAGS